MKEIWKKINGYDEYEISNLGRIRSFKKNKNNFMLKQRTTKDGYLRITLYKNGIAKKYLVHRLVAETFLDNYDETKIIHHIDYDNQNNNYKNLYICSRSEHTTLYNKTDKLIRKLIENNKIEFKDGEYYVCKN